MKHYEKLAVEYSKRFAKGWDYFCISSDAYSEGYRVGRKEADIDCNAPVELIFKDGAHQLAASSFIKYRNENEQLPFKDMVKTYLNMIDVTELRVEEKDGVISFQGMAKRKDSEANGLTYIEE